MNNDNNPVTEDNLRPVKTILVSQPTPPDFHKTPWAELERKYNVKVDFRSFIKVVPVDSKDFRKDRINPGDFHCVIFTSRYAVDNYFRICEEMRIKVSEETKYFCTTEAVALYLQRYTIYRKRKVFHGERSIEDLKAQLIKHKKKERFLLPMSNLGAKETTDYLREKDIDFVEAIMYNTISADLSDLADITYDMLVFFSPQGPESLFENFPSFKQNFTRVATYGKTTLHSALEKGIFVNVPAPSPEAPSITGAIENYLKKTNPKAPIAS